MLDEWARRWNIPREAIRDLQLMLGTDGTHTTGAPSQSDESTVQKAQRLIATNRGERVWRNNVGAGKLDNGDFVRWGLANDSKAVNDRIKSADLIGIRPVLIAPHHVGHTIGQFVSYECKRQGWRYHGTDHEIGQFRWAALILSFGGHAEFVT